MLRKHKLSPLFLNIATLREYSSIKSEGGCRLSMLPLIGFQVQRRSVFRRFCGKKQRVCGRSNWGVDFGVETPLFCYVAFDAAGAPKIFASFLRFWAVAASRNSSLAPHGPRNRSRPRPRMRLRCAKSISTFFLSFIEMFILARLGYVAGHLAGIFVLFPSDGAEVHVWTAACFRWATLTG